MLTCKGFKYSSSRSSYFHSDSSTFISTTTEFSLLPERCSVLVMLGTLLSNQIHEDITVYDYTPSLPQYVPELLVCVNRTLNDIRKPILFRTWCNGFINRNVETLILLRSLLARGLHVVEICHPSWYFQLPSLMSPKGTTFAFMISSKRNDVHESNLLQRPLRNFMLFTQLAWSS